MAKVRSFADKLKRKSSTIDCPVCQSPIRNLLVVQANNDNPKGSWKFRERFVRVCKCNHKEFYG